MNNMYEYLVKKNMTMRKKAYDGGANPNRAKTQDKLQKDQIAAITRYMLRPQFDVGRPAVEQALGVRLDSSDKRPVPGKKERKPVEKSVLKQLSDFAGKHKGAAIGGFGSMAVATPVAYSLSKENKLRNAALWGILSGILGTAGGAAYDKYMA